MIRSIPLSRALTQALMPVCVLCVLAFAGPAAAFTPSSNSKTGGENTPLDLSSSGTSHTSSSGPSVVRTIIALLIVIAVIWVITWILRQVKSGRETRTLGSSLSSVATLPLSPGRSVHLVRAGRDYVLLGSAEHGVVPIHRYSEQQAREAGLFNPDIDAPEEGSGGLVPATRGPRAAIEMPGQQGTGNILERLRQWTVRW